VGELLIKMLSPTFFLGKIHAAGRRDIILARQIRSEECSVLIMGVISRLRIVISEEQKKKLMKMKNVSSL